MDHVFQIALLLTSIRIMFAMNVSQIVCIVHHLIFVQNVLIHINYSTIVALLIAQMKCIPIIIISVKTVLAHALLVYLHNIVLIATQVFITCGNQMLLLAVYLLAQLDIKSIISLVFMKIVWTVVNASVENVKAVCLRTISTLIVAIKNVQLLILDKILHGVVKCVLTIAYSVQMLLIALDASMLIILQMKLAVLINLS